MYCGVSAVLESGYTGGSEAEFLFPALLQGDSCHSLYLAGPQFPHLQKKR